MANKTTVYNICLPKQVRDAMKERGDINWPWVLRNTIAAKLSERNENEPQRQTQPDRKELGVLKG